MPDAELAPESQATKANWSDTWTQPLRDKPEPKRTLTLVEVQLTAAQQKMEEAKAEMAAADMRQPSVQDTSIEILVQALRLQPQEQPLNAATREDLTSTGEHEGNATSATAEVSAI